jgi:hypothetical protein
MHSFLGTCDPHCLPSLLLDVKAIKMIVIQNAIAATLVCTQIAITECGTWARDKQLAVATMVVAIMVVHVMVVCFNVDVLVVCACLVLWVLTALVVGMLAVDAMQMAQLVELTVLGGSLAITVRVLVAGAMSFEAMMIAVVSRPAVASRPAIALATPHMAVVALLVFQEPLELLPVMLFELMAKLVLGSRTKLFCCTSSGLSHC